MNKQGTRIFRAILTAIVGTVLLWQVVTRSLVAYLANTAPEAALGFNSTDSKALLVLADRALAHMQRIEQAPGNLPSQVQERAEGLKQPQDRLQQWAERAFKPVERAPPQGESPSRPSEPAGFDATLAQQARTWTEMALANDPLTGRGLSLLGELAHMAGDEAAVAKLLEAAAGRGIRESAAVYWLMRTSYDNRDYATALYGADVLLRTRSQASADVMAVLVHMAENEQANSEVKAAVLSNPPWRANFLSAYARYAADPRASLELLLAMRETRTPPTDADLRNFVNALIGRKEYELAYYAWLQFLPPEQLSQAGFLFNGSFESAPSGLPFDWVISEGAGVLIDMVPRSDRNGERALLIEFGYGRVDFRGVQQLTALAPGSYKFKATYKGNISGKRGLVWRVACAETPGSPIGESPMFTGASPGWMDMEFAFVVPNKNCRAQYVRLDFDARTASEQLVSGSILYDDLRIIRVKEMNRS